MSLLADWDAGAALAEDTRERVTQSSALAIVVASDMSLSGYARGGSAAEAVWITAQQCGLGVQPISPPFLYAHDGADLDELSPEFATQLADLRSRFRQMTATLSSEAQILILRLIYAPPSSIRSRRRAINNAAPPVV